MKTLFCGAFYFSTIISARERVREYIEEWRIICLLMGFG